MGLWISSDPRHLSCFCHASALHPLSRSSSEVGPDRGASVELQRVDVCVFNFCHSPSNLSAARGFGPEQSLISALHRGPGYHQWVKCDSRVCVLTFQMLDVYKWAAASPHSVAFLILLVHCLFHSHSDIYAGGRPDLFTWDAFSSWFIMSFSDVLAMRVPGSNSVIQTFHEVGWMVFKDNRP